jgi:type 1 glutamine amidotransferase
VRQWGQGRVFYHSIGHATEDLAGEDVRRLTKQGIAWAARGSKSRPPRSVETIAAEHQ